MPYTSLVYRRRARYSDRIIQRCPECSATTLWNSKGVLPDISIRSNPAEYRSPRGKKLSLAASAVSNFADSTSCVHIRVPHTRPADAHVHATEARPGPPDASFQHAALRPACRCCTMQDLGHPKTVAGTVLGEFSRFVALKNHAGGTRARDGGDRFRETFLSQNAPICESVQRKIANGRIA